MSGVGRLASTGDGEMILIACYTHGVQRFDIEGRGEGAYHLGGSAGHAVPDFAGRTIAVSTLEGELAILSGAGNVRWRTTLEPTGDCAGNRRPRPLSDLRPGDRRGRPARLAGLGSSQRSCGQNTEPGPWMGLTKSRVGSAWVRVPDWTVEIVAHEDQAEFAVLAVSDNPIRVGVISHTNRLELFGPDGKRLGQAPEIDGVGRIVRTSPGWMAAATDRRLMLCDLRKNLAQRIDLSLAELTHLEIRPDRLRALHRPGDPTGSAGRLRPVGGSGRPSLKSSVEDLAINDEGFTAITTEDGKLRVFDPAGVSDDRVPGRCLPTLPFATGMPQRDRVVAWLSLSQTGAGAPGSRPIGPCRLGNSGSVRRLAVPRRRSPGGRRGR